MQKGHSKSFRVMYFGVGRWKGNKGLLIILYDNVGLVS